jgi:hypothetical protein
MTMLHPHARVAIDAATRRHSRIDERDGTFTNMDRMIDIVVPTIIGNMRK